MGLAAQGRGQREGSEVVELGNLVVAQSTPPD